MRRYRKISGALMLYIIFFLLIFLLPLAIISCNRNKADSMDSDLELSYEAVYAAYNYYKSSGINWIDLLAYASACKSRDKYDTDLIQQVVNALDDGTLKYNSTAFKKYRKLYSALLDGIFGSFSIRYGSQGSAGAVESTDWLPVKGLMLFHPIPKNFKYTHNDDFGASRSYDGIDSHEGNDIMADSGTPVVAIESGYVEKIGWNNAGGYRINIRSSDGKRLYYYAHFSMYSDATKQLVPAKGSTPAEKVYIEAGTIIGYVGSTGNSGTPGTNGLMPCHLHIQIGISPEKNKTIWANPYGFIKFIESNGLKQNMDNFIYIKTK